MHLSDDAFTLPPSMLAGPPVQLIWSTPHAEHLVVYMARVSSPQSQELHADPVRLLRYLAATNRPGQPHLSPFDMVSACVGIRTSRAIMHQVLRHWSFRFQEFSTRYAAVETAKTPAPGSWSHNLPKHDAVSDLITEARVKGATNRQSSLPTNDPDLSEWWADAQRRVLDVTTDLYAEALDMGIANELARNLLSEGLTPTTAYMSGSLRSWVFYLKSRLDPATQREHRDLAGSIFGCLQPLFPNTFEAFQLSP